MPNVISKEEARAAGLKRYFTGKPCRNSHNAERYVAGGMCVLCTKARSAKNSKIWKDAHRQEMREARREWGRRNAEKVRETNRTWAQENPAKRANLLRAWREANPEYHRRYASARRQAVSRDRLSSGVIGRLWKLQGGRCACPCQRALLRSKFHIDHIVPLAKGGRNIDSNVQLLRPVCNMRKHSKDNDVFFAEQARRFGGIDANA